MAGSSLRPHSITPGSYDGQFIGGNNLPRNVREEIVRIDENVSDKFTIYGHFVAEQIAQQFGTTMWSADNVPTMYNTFGNPSYAAVLHTAYTISALDALVHDGMGLTKIRLLFSLFHCHLPPFITIRMTPT
jgi:hypothetical protein